MKYNNIILVIVCMTLFYLLFLKKENMSNTDIKKIINEIYQADIKVLEIYLNLLMI